MSPQPGPEAAGVRVKWQPVVFLHTAVTQTSAAQFRTYPREGPLRAASRLVLVLSNATDAIRYALRSPRFYH